MLIAIVYLGAGAGPAGAQLDRGTASVLADDVGFDHYCDADCAVDLARCYRVDGWRVDCVMVLMTDSDRQYFVIATELRGAVLYFGDYWVKGHPRLTKAQIIRRSPPGFRPRPIAEIYAKSWWTKRGYKVFLPNRLAMRDVGYGRPRLRSVMREQCRLQPKLHCSSRR